MAPTVPTGVSQHDLALRAFTVALDECHERVRPGELVVSAGGWAVASAHRAGGPEVAGSSGELSAVRDAAPATASELAAFGDELLALHREALAGVLAGALVRLDQRVSEGSNLLNRQLVQGTVADVALALSEADDLLALPGRDDRRRARIHRRLTAAGRTALKLYGASSFAAEGPGRLLHLAELLGNTYLHPGEPDAEATG